MTTTPVIVGAAAITQRASENDLGLEPVDLMVEACQKAADAAGASEHLLAAVESVVVPRGTWRYPDAGRLVADRIGAGGATTTSAEIGILQTTALSAAIEDVASGRHDVALVTGGEALHRRRVARRRGVKATETTQSQDDTPQRILRSAVGFRGRHEDEWGIEDAFIQYALMDTARAYRLGLSANENHARIADLWSTLSEDAAGNPAAWEPQMWSAASILDHSRPGNRPVAWPYSVKVITQMYVDQASSLIVCSTDAAQRFGISADRWIYPAVTVDCEVTVPLVERSSPGECPQWNVIADVIARERGGRSFDTIDYVDLYSCFPIAVTHQLDAFGFNASHPITVTGGMTFGGGPLNNAALQAIARCVELMTRSDAGSEGFVTAVSGLLTKQGALLLRRAAPEAPYRRIDVTQAAEPLIGRREVVGRYTGVGVVEAGTIVFPKGGVPQLMAIVRTADGSGTVVRGDEPESFDGLRLDTLLGSQVDVVDGILVGRPDCGRTGGDDDRRA